MFLFENYTSLKLKKNPAEIDIKESSTFSPTFFTRFEVNVTILYHDIVMCRIVIYDTLLSYI